MSLSLEALPAPLRGVIATLLLVVNVLFWATLVLPVALIKLLLPHSAVRRQIDRVLNTFAECWISCNNGWMRLVRRTEWDVAGLEGLSYRDWYLVNCNHQSWVDILVLQRLLNRRIPLLKYFLKQELIYVPFMGLAWWALDFPFMRRHSDKVLRRHPEKRFEDLETTRKSCQKFALLPTSVANFVEGTRFTTEKHQTQRSTYRHLLKPRAGAFALSLNVLGDKFQALLDVTIVYPDGVPSFWDLLCGRVGRVVVRVNRRPIPQELLGGDYAGDRVYRKTFQRWLSDLWDEKDQQIADLLAQHGAAPLRAD